MATDGDAADDDDDDGDDDNDDDPIVEKSSLFSVPASASARIPWELKLWGRGGAIPLQAHLGSNHHTHNGCRSANPCMSPSKISVSRKLLSTVCTIPE